MSESFMVRMPTGQNTHKLINKIILERLVYELSYSLFLIIWIPFIPNKRITLSQQDNTVYEKQIYSKDKQPEDKYLILLLW